MFFVSALFCAPLSAQDWDAIQAKLAHADVRAVASMLSSADVYEREAALAQIARDDKRPGLTRAAADALDTLTSAEVKAQLIAVLAERNDPAASPAIRKALRDPDTDVRKAAITACGQMRDDKAADALADMHEWSSMDEVREALRRIPNPSIDRYLAKTVSTKSSAKRADALDLLAARHCPGVYALALNPQFFDGSDMALTKSAAAVIRTYAPEGGFRPLLDFAQKLQPGAVDLLLGTLMTTLNEAPDKAAQEQHIIAQLKACKPGFAPVLTALLGTSQGPAALSILSQRLGDDDVDTRKDAARNLGKWNSEDAIPALMFAGKNDRDLGVQNLAWRMMIDVARRDEKMKITNRVVAALGEAIWFAPRRAERSAALDTLKTYVKKNDSVKGLIERIELERIELADEIQQLRQDLNWKK
jgi:hypothetical protein